MNEKDKKAFFKRMQVLEKNLEDNNEEKLKKLTQLYIEKKSLGIVETKPNNNFEEIKEKLAKLFNMNFDKTYKQTHPFNLDVLKELKELKNQIKKALSTKDVSLIDSFMPLAAGFSQTRYNYDNFTNINFEYGLNKILKLPIEKKELVLQTLLDKTTKKINLFNFQLEDTQKNI